MAHVKNAHSIFSNVLPDFVNDIIHYEPKSLSKFWNNFWLKDRNFGKILKIVLNRNFRKCQT